MIRVWVASPDAAERLGLTTIVTAQADMELRGQSDSLPAHLAGIDLVLADTRLIGPQTVGRLQATRFLLIATHPEEEGLRIGLRAGATGYVLKGMTHSELVAAIHTAVGFRENQGRKQHEFSNSRTHRR